jgi:hypothetical protein
VQLGSAPHVRGRVMALYVLVFMGGTPVGAPLIGRSPRPSARAAASCSAGAVVAVSGVVAAVVMTAGARLRLEPTSCAAARTCTSGRSGLRGPSVDAPR